MADDREILKELWESKIPVNFTLPIEEVESGEEPDSICLMLRRLSYFPLVTDKVSKYFSKFIKQDEPREMWLAYASQPLKCDIVIRDDRNHRKSPTCPKSLTNFITSDQHGWHYPIGVLYDIYSEGDSMPWNVTVHFQEFPEDELLHCPSKDAVESQFMSMLKEADSLKHKSQVINSMQKKDHKEIWRALMHEKYEPFWTVNKRLMESSGDDMFKYIPFRIYQMDKPNIQKIFKPFNAEGKEQKLGDLLQECVPHLWHQDSFIKRAVTHGIDMTLDTPILWLSQNFSYPDNFLHICILDKTDTG